MIEVTVLLLWLQLNCQIRLKRKITLGQFLFANKKTKMLRGAAHYLGNEHVLRGRAEPR